tara:strand:- start:605 stop:1204 length:600 start_codon:yes stop_codon:yes gene_type:complete
MDYIKKNTENNYITDYNYYLKHFLLENDLLDSNTSDKIIFKAKSIESLDNYLKKNFLDDKYIEKFIHNLGSQIMNLKKQNFGILYFSLKDIVIINSNIFLFINPNKLFSLGANNLHNTLSSFIKENTYDEDFIPPELKNTLNLTNLNLARGEVFSYYSLAKIILFTFNLELENLYYTKLYFFLNRCLESTPNKRIFLYV